MNTLYFQAENTFQNVQYNRGEDILFDKIMSQSENIEFVQETGVVYIYTAGIYLVEWTVTTNDAFRVDKPVFAINTSNNESFIGDYITVEGESLGHAIIQANPEGVSFTLRNIGSSIILGSVPVTASLTVYSITDMKSELTNIPVYGRFVGYSNGMIEYDSLTNVIILPVERSSMLSSADDFTVNTNGSVTVNMTGIYRVDSTVHLIPLSTNALVALQINEQIPSDNWENVYLAGNADYPSAYTSTIVSLSAGDNVSVAFIVDKLESGGGNILLIGSDRNTTLPSVSMNIIKIA